MQYARGKKNPRFVPFFKTDRGKNAPVNKVIRKKTFPVVKIHWNMSYIITPRTLNSLLDLWITAAVTSHQRNCYVGGPSTAISE